MKMKIKKHSQECTPENCNVELIKYIGEKAIQISVAYYEEHMADDGRLEFSPRPVDLLINTLTWMKNKKQEQQDEEKH